MEKIKKDEKDKSISQMNLKSYMMKYKKQLMIIFLKLINLFQLNKKKF